MVQMMSEYYIVARCKRCQGIVKDKGVDPTDIRAAAETADDWRQEGYAVDKVTRGLLNAIPRGCLCKGETA